MDTAHKKAFEFLNDHKLATLSTSSEDGTPWGAAIYYVVDEHFNFYFLTHSETKKYFNMQKHHSAAITVVDDYLQTTVQASGQTTAVSLGPEHDHAFRMLALVHPPGQFYWVPPVSKMHNGPSMLLKLTPKFLRLSNFKPEHGEVDIVQII